MRKGISSGLALAAVMLATAAALRYAQGSGLMGADVARRTMLVVIGLTLAAYANVIPKDIGRWRASVREAKRTQTALRLGGWSFTLAGLAFAALWAFAPAALADVAAPVAVAAAMVVTATYGAWTLPLCRQTADDTLSPLETRE